MIVGRDAAYSRMFSTEFPASNCVEWEWISRKKSHIHNEAVQHSKKWVGVLNKYLEQPNPHPPCSPVLPAPPLRILHILRSSPSLFSRSDTLEKQIPGRWRMAIQLAADDISLWFNLREHWGSRAPSSLLEWLQAAP